MDAVPESAPSSASQLPDPPATAPPPTPPSHEVDARLDKFRGDIAETIKKTFPRLFWVTIIVASFLILLAILGFAFERTMDAAVLAASLQVAFGMVIGFVCVYLGLMMTWFGIDAAYTLQGSVHLANTKVDGALKSASPGLLFALAGIVLIGVSLHKQIVFQENKPSAAGSVQFGQEAENQSVKMQQPARILVAPDPARNRQTPAGVAK